LNRIVDNAAGPTGVVGIIIGMSPDCPQGWLILFSIVLVLCQLIHWFYRLYKWIINK